MEESGGEGRGLEDAAHGHDGIVQGDGHRPHALCREVGQAAVDDLGEPIDALLIEGDGRFGAEPLVLEVEAGGPLPTAVALRLDGNLFAQDLAVLLLLEAVEVLAGEVLIHEHVVAEELEACGAGHHDAAEVVFGIEAKGEEVAQVARLAVVCHQSRIGALLSSIGIAPLPGPLVTC